MRAHHTQYKGKTTRSWTQLPEELVRHIATYYLWDLAATTYCPHTWEAREFWHPRMVYTSLRDAADLETQLMAVCPQWGAALETHLFWQQAVALIDPVDYLAHHAVVHPKSAAITTHSSSIALIPVRLSPYRHFRNITVCSCFVCRINSPQTTAGLASAKRSLHSPYLGAINLCREHDRRRISFCGLCLRDGPPCDPEPQSTPRVAADLLVACLENEDEETWPNIDATCRQCRSEWLWRRAGHSQRDREAVGGNQLVSDDWETRQCVDAFLDLAEGSISDVINMAREKWWLRKHTRIIDMMQQALAAAKFNSSSGTDILTQCDSMERRSRTFHDEQHQEEDEDEDDDAQLMQLTEEGGVRDLALGDWARTRILDGHWISPADIWYGNNVPGQPSTVPALHPCPWTRDQALDGEEDREEEHHPTPATVRADIPPSYALCEQTYVAHSRQMRLVLLPALRNVVRWLVVDCALSGGNVTPAMRATRMSMEDVLRVLREEEGVWLDGVDWIERRKADEATLRKEGKGLCAQNESSLILSASMSSDGSSNRSSRGSSNVTSPESSTTTLQTTPSPPPVQFNEEHGVNVKEGQELRTAIPVAPVLHPPRLLRPIPFVPVTSAHMASYSLEAVMAVWREACAPLYQCKCRICNRAMALEAASTSSADGSPVVPTHHIEVTPSVPKRVKKAEIIIKLDDGDDCEGDGEEEEESAIAEEEEEEEEENLQYDDDDDDDELLDDFDEYHHSPSKKLLLVSPERSSDELIDTYERSDLVRRCSGGTPSKHACRDELMLLVTHEKGPAREKKRGSEEVSDGTGGPAGGMKRSRIERIGLLGTGDKTKVGTDDSDSYGDECANDARRKEPRTVLVTQADLECLYVLGDCDRG